MRTGSFSRLQPVNRNTSCRGRKNGGIHGRSGRQDKYLNSANITLTLLELHLSEFDDEAMSCMSGVRCFKARTWIDFAIQFDL